MEYYSFALYPYEYVPTESEITDKYLLYRPVKFITNDVTALYLPYFEKEVYLPYLSREVSNQEVSNQEVSNREISNQEVSNREISNRECKKRSVNYDYEYLQKRSKTNNGEYSQDVDFRFVVDNINDGHEGMKIEINLPSLESLMKKA